MHPLAPTRSRHRASAALAVLLVARTARATSASPDAGAAAHEPDAGPAVDATPEARPTLPEPVERLDGGLIAAPESDAGAPAPEELPPDAGSDEPDAAPGSRQIDLEVGCACRVGARGDAGGGLALAMLVAVVIVLARRRVPHGRC